MRQSERGYSFIVVMIGFFLKREDVDSTPMLERTPRVK